MKDQNLWNESQTMEQLSVDDGADELEEIFENFILDAKYEKVTAAEVAAAQKHLTGIQHDTVGRPA